MLKTKGDYVKIFLMSATRPVITRLSMTMEEKLPYRSEKFALKMKML